MVYDRKAKLRTLINEANSTLSSSEMETFYKLLSEHHEAFSLEKNERGETDLI